MTGRYPLIVAARMSLAFVLESDFVFCIDSDTLTMHNPFPALLEEIKTHPKAVLFGVQDVAAEGDKVFKGLLREFDVKWKYYQQGAILMFRSGDAMRSEIRSVFREWGKITRALHFAEQDALAIWFSSDLKAMMRPSLNRQWLDCGIGKTDSVERLICHGRGGLKETWPYWHKDMRKAGIINLNEVNRCCPGL
jgi:hypothetical protein